MNSRGMHVPLMYCVGSRPKTSKTNGMTCIGFWSDMVIHYKAISLNPFTNRQCRVKSLHYFVPSQILLEGKKRSTSESSDGSVPEESGEGPGEAEKGAGKEEETGKSHGNVK